MYTIQWLLASCTGTDCYKEIKCQLQNTLWQHVILHAASGITPVLLQPVANEVKSVGEVKGVAGGWEGWSSGKTRRGMSGTGPGWVGLVVPAISYPPCWTQSCSMGPSRVALASLLAQALEYSSILQRFTLWIFPYPEEISWTAPPNSMQWLSFWCHCIGREVMDMIGL